MAKTTGDCVRCGDDVGAMDGGRLYCDPCRIVKASLLTNALRIVRREISAGRLIHPRNLVCKDCGAQARCYDHRSYAEPLKVEPVCYLCNKRRGPVNWVADLASQIPRLNESPVSPVSAPRLSDATNPMDIRVSDNAVISGLIGSKA